MRMIAGMIGFAALGSLVIAPVPSQAAQPPRVPAGDCGTLAASGAKSLWQAWFYGEREGLFENNRTYYQAAPCFPSQATCKAWLYWAQSDWPSHNNFRPCRKGIVY